MPLALYGEITRSAPARLSFFSVSERAARATIGMSARSSRAVSVMNTFSASESAHATSEQARSMPACSRIDVIRRVALDEADAEPLGAGAVAIVGIDDDEGGLRRVQIARDLAPDAAEPADDVVVCERVDHPLHAPRGEQVADMPGDEELRHRGERVEERTDAQDGQQDDDDLPGGRVRLRKAADGRGRVERPAERVPEVDMLAESETDRSQEQQPGRGQAEQSEAPDEDRQLVGGGGAGAFVGAMEHAVEVRHGQPR